MTTLLTFTNDRLYPESDDQPMSESTEQYRWIVMVKENLEILFTHQPNVFIGINRGAGGVVFRVADRDGTGDRR